MSASRPVNVVVRSLALLRALNRQPVSSVDRLHRQTGLPKPTIVRLLHTLESEGLVRRAPQYGAYVLTSAVRELSCGFHADPRVLEAAAPAADALTQQLRWPVSVALLDVDAVVVRYSTIPASPLSLYHSTLNMRLSLIHQALGRAYLAFCDRPTQEALIRLRMAAGPEAGEPPFGSVDDIFEMLDRVRACGYALRDPRVRPETSTIAVPLIDGGRPVASIGLTWFSSALESTQAVERFRAPLVQAAQAVGLALASLR